MAGPRVDTSNVEAVRKALRQVADSAVPFRANGQCRFAVVHDSGRIERFSLPVNIFVNPPYEIYMQGQVGIGPGGLVFLGADQQQYWVGIRPQLNSFWWGNWSSGYDGRLPISPGIILESLGLMADADPNRIRLSAQSGRAVVTYLDANGRARKRVFLQQGTARVRRIEYLDDRGQLAASVELARYERLTEVFFVPSRITAEAYEEGKRTCWVRLSLSSIMHRRYNEQFRQRYFRRPEPYGFERVIQIGQEDLK